jgi:hypothetical protein
LRTKRPAIDRGDIVVVYARVPLKAVVGHFTVGEIVSGTPRAIWSVVGGEAASTRRAYFRRFADSPIVHAIQVRRPQRVDPYTPSFRVGQGWRFLDRRMNPQHQSRPSPDSSAAVLVQVFPQYSRATLNDVRESLERNLPTSALQQQGMKERLDALRAYKDLRREWDELNVRHDPLTGLYVAPYPPWAIASWEDAAEVQKGAPKPEGRLERTAGKQLILHREHRVPLLIEED